MHDNLKCDIKFNSTNMYLLFFVTHCAREVGIYRMKLNTAFALEISSCEEDK